MAAPPVAFEEDDLDALLEEEEAIERSSPSKKPAPVEQKEAPAKIGEPEAPEVDIDQLLEEEEQLAQAEAAGGNGANKNQKQLVKKSFACVECGEMSVSNNLFQQFKLKVCYTCKKASPKYKLMSKTTAKEDYLLTTKDLKKLDSIQVRNPRRTGWNDMQLFMTLHVEAKSIEKYGSLKAMEKEKRRRAKTRIQKKEQSMRKEKGDTNLLAKSIKRLRAEVSTQKDASSKDGASEKSPSPNKRKKQRKTKEMKYIPRYREHTYGPSKQKSNGVWIKKCTECNFEVEFEQM